MNNKRIILKGTLILTVAGVITRLIGFYYRIFLSHKIGAEQLGIYQLIFPLLVLLYSLTSSGIHLVISRQVAKNACVNTGENPKQILAIGLLISLLLSFAAVVFMNHYGTFLAERFLGEPRCAPLLKIAAYCVPLSSVHMCVEGYYYGQRKTAVPAFCGLMEQLVRVFAVWLICRITLAEGGKITVEAAVWGLLLGEAASTLISLTALSFEETRLSLSSLTPACIKTTLGAFFRQGIPLTANRMLLNGLQSLEAVLIPARLRMFGLTPAESLSIYGVLTGMALPFILFPSTLTNSASTMLMPTVAQAQANHQETSLKSTVEYTLKYCLLLGIFCTGIFVIFGNQIGAAVFHNDLAGRFLSVLGWICPLLYISATFGSVLHGLGKTTTVFLVNSGSLTLRILFVLFLIPRYSILGYLWGMLACHLLSAFLYYGILQRSLHFHVSAWTCVGKPCIAMAVSCGLAAGVMRMLPALTLPLLLLVLCGCGVCYLALILLFGCLREFQLIKRHADKKTASG